MGMFEMRPILIRIIHTESDIVTHGIARCDFVICIIYNNQDHVIW